MMKGNIKDVNFKKGMVKDEVNELIGEWLILEDDVYLGAHHKHNWKCKCGNVFDRRWNNIKRNNNSDCGCVEYNQQEERYKYEVEKTGEYEYIRSYRRGDVLPNGKVVGDSPYIQIKHKYCGSIYEVVASEFIKVGQRCGKCCGSYENSFAYYIEQELNEPIKKYWYFFQNTVNPYHISRGSHKKVWIKCTETDYHGSYEVRCSDFIKGKRCSYCSSRKVHPKDSFVQYCIDNIDKDFLTKHWSDKNTVDPWTIARSSGKKVWIKCQEKDYHNDYEVSCDKFISGRRCPYCANHKTHIFDSFGYHNFDKVMSWHPDNDISPFRVAPNSKKKFKFICPDCGYKWNSALYAISNGGWCPQCNSSKGEKEITKWLRLNNIEFIAQKTFDGLVGLGGGNLSYDFYLPEYNLLIEYQGKQHEEFIKYFYMTECDFNKQQEHDRRKREYAKKNNIELLEIWYWDFDNIEEILYKQIKFKINLKDIKNVA